MVRCNIEYPHTTLIVNEVLGNLCANGQRRPSYLEKEFTLAEHGADFLALLGTPNASGSGYSLAWHKGEYQLGLKTIESIQVFLCPELVSGGEVCRQIYERELQPGEVALPPSCGASGIRGYLTPHRREYVCVGEEDVEIYRSELCLVIVRSIFKNTLAVYYIDEAE